MCHLVLHLYLIYLYWLQHLIHLQVPDDPILADKQLVHVEAWSPYQELLDISIVNLINVLTLPIHFTRGGALQKLRGKKT